MIQIALCDDDAHAREEIMGFITRYRAERGREISAAVFSGSVELLAAMERGARFDVLFLDILMPGQNGIETAEEIRGYDSSVKIVFLTSSAEFAVQSYGVDAHFYQLKPVRWEGFACVLDSALDACVREQRKGLLLQCKNGITRLDPGRLEFCEVLHRTPRPLWLLFASPPLLPCPFRLCAEHFVPGHHHAQPEGNTHPKGEI